MLDQQELGRYKVEQFITNGVFTAPKQYTYTSIDMADGKSHIVNKGKGVKQSSFRINETAHYQQENSFRHLVDSILKQTVQKHQIEFAYFT